jgi:hypothetical protein
MGKVEGTVPIDSMMRLQLSCYAVQQTQGENINTTKVNILR